ncbi:interaptin-like, partial [Rhopilema esculentum]|uniref:interaptin-like n=1 Tax=Rhopilema esculentum TaxID=499914 RepID=UPI0031D6379B
MASIRHLEMGESYNNASEMELSLPNDDNDGSVEDQKEKIRILAEELREELILSNSLTNIITEKSSEIDYLKNKVEEQDAKIRNLEDQIEEWTNQSEACDKVLEQKDCEIEMFKKTLSIEKQQRRDLEDMTMEVGKENIKERELLENKIEELQGRIVRMEEENKKGKVEAMLSLTPTNTQAETANEGKTLDIKNEEKPVKEESSKELDSQLNEEYKADMEVLMNDLFVLIKKNEELKEEVEKLKKEQVNILEDKRSVVTDLETTLEEKSAEIQHQKHEIRRLSSAVEVGDATTDIEKYNQAKQLRKKFEDKIEHLETTNSEMKNILEENKAAKETLARQLQKTKKKLQMEREQNTELNKQILEVSTLYDTFYSRCEELEKGRVKGLSCLRKDATVPTNDNNTNSDAVTKENAGDKDDANDEIIGYDAIETDDKNISSRDSENSISSVVDSKVDEPCTETSTRSLDKDEGPESKMSCSGEDLASSPGQEKKGKKKLSKKKRAKLKKQTSSEVEIEDSRPRWSELFLSLSTSLFKILLLVATTFVAVSTMHVHFGVSIVNAFAGMFVAYFVFINIWRILSPQRQRQLHQKNGATVYPDSNTKTLRRAMQDLIMRLGDDDFKQFSETYEKYIDQTFAEEQASLSGNLKDEVIYLTAAKDVLSKELAKYKDQNHSIHITYEEMKADIEKFRAKRAEEEEEKDKVIRSLKDEISSLEGNLKKEGKSSKDKDERPTFKVNGLTYAKFLVFIVLDVCVVLTVGNSAIVYPFLFLSALLIGLVYRADMQLIQTLTINKGYQITIQDLLCKVDEYKKEEKQISSEVKELEALVDKDYEIISKQRNAIERLERQLNRAINKYTEKKRALGKVIWLQERNIESHPDSKSNIFGEEYIGSFSESLLTEERSHSNSRSPKYSVLGTVAIAFLKFSGISLLGVAFSVLYGCYKAQSVAPDMKP